MSTAPVNGAVKASVVERLLARAPRRETTELVLDDDGEETVVVFTFEAISSEAYDALVMEHQPDDEEREKSPGWPWNQKTFPPALISASLIDPELTEAEAAQLLASKAINHGEAADLFDTAIRVNTRRRLRALGKGSGTTPSSPAVPPTP